MTEYATTAGTAPDPDEHHEARTMTRTSNDGTVYMMTEIGDGTFVQWSTCTRCHERIAGCKCADGPAEPAYMEAWRTRRFIDSFTRRGAEPPLPTAIKTRSRVINAVLRELRDKGWTITAPDNPTAEPVTPTLPKAEDGEAVEDGLTNALAAVRARADDDPTEKEEAVDD